MLFCPHRARNMAFRLGPGRCLKHIDGDSVKLLLELSYR